MHNTNIQTHLRRFAHTHTHAHTNRRTHSPSKVAQEQAWQDARGGYQQAVEPELAIGRDLADEHEVQVGGKADGEGTVGQEVHKPDACGAG